MLCVVPQPPQPYVVGGSRSAVSPGHRPDPSSACEAHFGATRRSTTLRRSGRCAGSGPGGWEGGTRGNTDREWPAREGGVEQRCRGGGNGTETVPEKRRPRKGRREKTARPRRKARRHDSRWEKAWHGHGGQ
jgi:hypothetical protein